MVSLKTIDQNNISRTIKRTLKTAKLFDVFWERWIVHGLDPIDLTRVRQNLTSIEDWNKSWENLAKEKENKAVLLEKEGSYSEAEYVYRQTALLYNLNYWINPAYNQEKINWYNKCLHFIQKADNISEVETIYKTLAIDDDHCSGRIRIPSNAKGCIVIINPIDSSKEELFKYEMDFLNEGFITISFDGPGQGETFLFNKVIGTRERWERFTNLLIDYTSTLFPNLPIYLFGISLGASWVLYGSANEKVEKAVAVSPAVELDKMNMPAYFMDRMNCSCVVEAYGRAIPKFNEIHYKNPIMVFHGNEDMMVPNEEMYELVRNIPSQTELIEYNDEGHCCNNRLDEIRKISIRWFTNQLQFERGTFNES